MRQSLPLSPLQSTLRKSLKVAPMLLATLSTSLFNSTVQANEQPSFCGTPLPLATQLEEIVPALYGVVSGGPNEQRNWDLLRNLFAPGATITPVFHQGDTPQIEPMPVDEFIALNQQIFDGVGFYETEVDSVTWEVGHMATVISLYESREAPDQPAYSRGINSFQLLNDGQRWCVISVTWDSDKGQHVIPPSLK